MLAGKIRRQGGKQHLSTTSNRHDASVAVEYLPIIILGAQLRFAAMQSHTNLEREITERLLECALCCKCRLERDDGLFKDTVNAITCRLDNRAPVRFYGLVHYRIVLRQGILHRFRMFFPKLCTAFDVGKEKSHRPGWQSTHKGSLLTCTSIWLRRV
jgi:hypothetical protein